MTEAVTRLLEAFRERKPLRSGSLIITLYGDAIAPHGGTVWLGSLINLLEHFGINQRLVRTSVFRLAQEGWLSAQQVGRRSYYSLTDSGRRRFENAFRRIYAQPTQQWNGRWCLVFTALPDLDAASREQLQRELGWQGFGTLAPGVLAHPGLDAAEIQPTLEAQGAQHKVVVMNADGGSVLGEQPLRELVNLGWDMAHLAESWGQFLERFRAVWRALANAQSLDPQECLLVRTLLIHEYRRLLLRDPQLPDELMPADWAGTAARLLCRNLYRLLQGPAERHLLATMETADGPLPEAAPYYFSRFGGLDQPPDALN